MVKVKDVEIDNARVSYIDLEQEKGRLYETIDPEINWMLYMKNELDLIFIEYNRLSSIVSSESKTNITLAIKSLWNAIKKDMKDAKTMLKQNPEKIKLIDDNIEYSEVENKGLFDKLSKNFSRENMKNDINDVLNIHKDKLESIQPFLLDIIQNQQTTRDIVYKFTIMTRNFLNVINTNISSSTCKCCKKASKYNNNPCINDI